MTVEEFLLTHPDEDVVYRYRRAGSCWITDRPSACWAAGR